jgi:hypothetical protein
MKCPNDSSELIMTVSGSFWLGIGEIKTKYVCEKCGYWRSL